MNYFPTGVNDPEIFRELRTISQLFQVVEAGKLEIAVAAPEKPETGWIRIPDGVNWMPLGPGISRPVWFNGTAWVGFESV